MWLSDRRKFLLLTISLPLAGCGYTPLYAPGGSLGELQDRVRMADPRTREDFQLKADLENRLGEGSDFDLSWKLSITETDAGITPDQVITRREIIGSAEFTLTDGATGAVLMTGKIPGTTSYGTTATTASTAFARTAAYDRLMVIFADGIVTRLATLKKVPR